MYFIKSISYRLFDYSFQIVNNFELLNSSWSILLRLRTWSNSFHLPDKTTAAIIPNMTMLLYTVPAGQSGVAALELITVTFPSKHISLLTSTALSSYLSWQSLSSCKMYPTYNISVIQLKPLKSLIPYLCEYVLRLYSLCKVHFLIWICHSVHANENWSTFHSVCYQSCVLFLCLCLQLVVMKKP